MPHQKQQLKENLYSYINLADVKYAVGYQIEFGVPMEINS
jgi:hypothetical protein